MATVKSGHSSLLLLLLLLAAAATIANSSLHYHDYIIIGAGPAGLQLGHYLQKAGRDYVILERALEAGSFFTKFPRHEQLISINKRHTGKTNVEFNLRHDWNSLISDDVTLKFGSYSRLMFPSRHLLVTYLNDYARKLNLRVHYDSDVRNVTRVADDVMTCAGGCGNDDVTGKEDATGEKKEGGGMKMGREKMRSAHEAGFTMNDQHGNVFACRYLIVATGMWQPYAPHVEGEEYFEGYESVSVNPDDFEGQTVLILGRGNSAFEVAKQIYGATNLIHMIGRSRVRLSWSTHYVGDLRAVNNDMLDTYQLKSLDAILEAPVEKMRIVRRENKFYLEVRADDMTTNNRSVTPDNVTSAGHAHSTGAVGGRFTYYDNFAMREPYDRVIRCLGFQFNESLFSSEMHLTHPRDPKHRKSKYPQIDHGYESVDYQNLFFAGTASHSLDLRKSAGGFIHGFRYTSRALHRLMEWRNHGVTWPVTTGNMVDLLATILKRVNEASGIYQMFGMLGDIVILRGNAFEYIEEYPVNLLHELPQRTGHSDIVDIIVVMLEYGANFSGPGQDVFRLDRATGDPEYAHSSNFLHPVLYYYESLPTAADMARRRRWDNLPRPDRLHHCVEDFLTSWDAPISHILPMRRFLEAVLGRDLKSYFADRCLVAALTHAVLPATCEQQFLAGRGLARPFLAQASLAPPVMS